jgi:hypothetical protein
LLSVILAAPRAAFNLLMRDATGAIKRLRLCARGSRDKVFCVALESFERQTQGEMFEAAGEQSAGA